MISIRDERKSTILDEMIEFLQKNCKFYAASNQDTIDVQLLIYCERILWNFLKVDNSLKIIIE